MEKLLFKSQNLENESDIIKNLLDERKDQKVLLINLTKENRHLEIALGIENMIIYNSYDYIKGLCNLDKARFELDDNISVLPSTIKDEKISLLFDKLEEDIAEAEESYDLILIVCQDEADLVSEDTIELFKLDKKEDLSFIQKILAFFGKKYD